jgi:hypothetical protein
VPRHVTSNNRNMEGTRTNDEIEVLIARFFSVFDNRAGAVPRLRDVTDCFTEKATIAHRTSARTELCSPAEFAIPRIEMLTGGTLLDFHELEVSSAMQVFDGIAARISRYRKSGLLNGSEYSGSGTKCFQLAEVGVGWRIASLAWVDDKTCRGPQGSAESSSVLDLRRRPKAP